MLTIPTKIVSMFQVDPRCVIQYMRWYHEPLDGPMAGERVQIKAARTGGEPYVHTIGEVTQAHLGKYTCVIKNVMGITECSAHLSISSGSKTVLTTGWTVLTVMLLAISSAVI